MRIHINCYEDLLNNSDNKNVNFIPLDSLLKVWHFGPLHKAKYLGEEVQEAAQEKMDDIITE